MTEHIGIVAVSAPGAALCWETICAEASERMGLHAHPEVSMHAFSFAEHVRRMEAGDWAGVAELIRASAEKLAEQGADFAICPDNTAHQAIDLALDRDPEAFPLPWLHIADAVAGEAARRRVRRLGVLGTRFLMEGPVYPAKLAGVGVEWRVPPAPERARVDAIIFGDLVFGRVTEEARSELLAIIDALRKHEDCDAVLLGCTELPLAVSPERSPLSTLDSTRILARAALERALARRGA